MTHEAAKLLGISLLTRGQKNPKRKAEKTLPITGAVKTTIATNLSYVPI